MDRENILKQIQNTERLQGLGFRGAALLAGTKQLVRSTYGVNNAFYEQLTSIVVNWPDSTIAGMVQGVLDAFKDAVKNDLIAIASVERQAQIDVVSDYLDQSNLLLETKGFHPAAAAILIGASLEEFLRTWAEDEGHVVAKSDGIDTYAQYLKNKSLLDKQDYKDITAWAGIRNAAAHGHWDEVEDRKKVRLMLDGVNHFMRVKANP